MFTLKNAHTTRFIVKYIYVSNMDFICSQYDFTDFISHLFFIWNSRHSHRRIEDNAMSSQMFIKVLSTPLTTNTKTSQK